MSSPHTVCLLTLMHGLVSYATMDSEPTSLLLGVVSDGRAAIIFLFLLLTLTCGLDTIFSNETCFPKILEPIKQYPRNHKNTNNSYLDI
jgi:hypothetical protein